MTAWTEADVPDQAGRVALVTGANSGLGFHVTRVLAGSGAHVILGCRDAPRATTAMEQIQATVPQASLELCVLDLADLDSVTRFSEEVSSRHARLDILVNNAGVMAVPTRHTTAQGHELQFGTNHLGHFALTARLFPLLREGDDARVVTVTSSLHRRGSIDFDDIDAERGYSRWRAYGNSKLANLLFAFELDRRLRATRNATISVAAHPGYAATELSTSGPGLDGRGVRVAAMEAVEQIFAQSAARGALPLLYAATAPDVAGGDYYAPRGILEWRGSPAKARATRRARDEKAAARLWELSSRITGVSFDL